MAAFPSLPAGRDTYAGDDVGFWYAPTHMKIVVVAPDISRCNRADRRTMRALAKKYGWQLRDDGP